MKKQKHLDPKRYKTLLKHLDHQETNAWNIALRVMLRTGCRSKELMMITREHLDTCNGSLTVPAVKGSNERIVPLSKRVLVDLEHLLHTSGSMADALGGTAMSTKLRELRRRFKLEVFRALGDGFSHISPHSARSSFAVNIYLNAGQDILLVQELLGHRSIGSTMYYVSMSRAMERKKGLLKAIG